MQFPESWLREFCNPPLTTARAGRPADHGRPGGRRARARWRRRSPAWSWPRSLEAEPHPNADRLRVCKVDAGARGDGRCRSSAARPTRASASRCRWRWSAPSCRPARTASPSRSSVGKLRGVESQGMLCSARELKLSDDHGGLLELPADAPVGADIRELLELDDTLFTLKLTPNLAHCLSVYGVAREVVGADRRAAADAADRSRSPPTHDQTPAGAGARRPTCAAASPAASCAASTRRPRRRRGWSSAWRAAASAR